jgi:hypothetical protein
MLGCNAIWRGRRFYIKAPPMLLWARGSEIKRGVCFQVRADVRARTDGSPSSQPPAHRSTPLQPYDRGLSAHIAYGLAMNVIPPPLCLVRFPAERRTQVASRSSRQRRNADVTERAHVVPSSVKLHGDADEALAPPPGAGTPRGRLQKRRGVPPQKKLRRFWDPMELTGASREESEGPDDLARTHLLVRTERSGR